MLAASIICLFAYIFASIPTGYWLGKALKGIDIRQVGSCSTGATNVLRCVGKPAALFTLFFDMFKGALPVLLAIAACDPLNQQSLPIPAWLSLRSDPLFQDGAASFISKYYVLPTLVALITLFAHSKSIFLGFSGGKSAATGLGAYFAMSPATGISLFLIFVGTIALTRYVSLASMTAAFLGPFLMYYFTGGQRPSFVAFAITGGLYVILRHKTNIKRLLSGEEAKFGQKVASPQTGTSTSAGIASHDTSADPEANAASNTSAIMPASSETNENKNSASSALIVFLIGLLSLQAGLAPGSSAKSTGQDSGQKGKQAKASPSGSSASSKTPAKDSGAKWPVVFQTAPSSAITAEEANNVRLYKQASKAVVNVTTSTVTPESVMWGINPSSDTGSGSIISADGYVLTNHHVINGASVVRITLYDGTPFLAKIIGVDPDKDLAVLKIDPGTRKLATIKLGDSSNIEVGRRVFAIGNPFGLDLTMTSGIISSVGRTMKSQSGRMIKGVLQTDASINPGNSGGPLLDTQGNMIGVTTAIFSKVGQSSGIAFAIPINVVKKVVPQLVEHGVVLRPDLGILSVRPVTSTIGNGLMIASLDPSGPAAEAGLHGPTTRRGKWGGFDVVQLDNSTADVIVGVDAERVSSIDDLLSYIETKKPGQVVTLNVLRQGQVSRIPVKLSETRAHSE